MPHLPQLERAQRPGRRPWFYVRIRGEYHHLGTVPRAARLRYAALIREHYGNAVPDHPPTYVAELVERWQADHPADAKPWSALSWARYAGTARLDSLTADHLEGYVRWLQAGYDVPETSHSRGHTPHRAGSYTAWSIRERVGYALRICRWGHGRGWLSRVPTAPRLHTPVRLPRDIPLDRLRAAIAALPKRARALLAFVAETGCRPSEARLLRWEHVDRARGLILLPAHKTAGKTGAVRCIPLTLTALPPEGTTTPWVFPSRCGKPYTMGGLRSILRRHAPGITPYQLRHTFAQHAVDSGLPLDDVAALLGHTDSRTTRWYADIRAGRLQRAAASLTSPLQPPPPADHSAPPAGPAAARRTPRKSARGRSRTA